VEHAKELNSMKTSPVSDFLKAKATMWKEVQSSDFLAELP
jgi:hypothetical protein